MVTESNVGVSEELGLSERGNMDILRTPSAPVTVEGGGVFNGNSNGGVERELTAEELRCYLNPRRGPGLGLGLGGVGDCRKPINDHSNNITNDDENNPLFSKQVAFSGSDVNNEWNGGVGLPGLGLGTRQKSIVEIIQDDLNHSTFDKGMAASGGQFAPLSSSDEYCAGGHIRGSSLNHNTDVSASLSYASALGGSLSSSTTPDPQITARAPSPRILPVGEGRVNSMDKRGFHSPNSVYTSPNGPSSTADLVAALSGMNLSTDPQMDEEKQMLQQFQRRSGDHQHFYNLHGDPNHAKQTSQLDASEFRSFQQPKVSFPSMVKGNGVAVNENYYLRADGYVDHHKHSGPNSPPYFHSIGSPSSAIPNYSLSGHNINPALASMMAGQLGSSTSPPLFESAAASAVGAGGLDWRTLGASLASHRGGGHSAGNGLHDPLYLHYLTSMDYNDPSFDGSNSYMDLLTLQKAYLGSLLSARKSESGRPYAGKCTGLNNGYCGNPAYGIGSAYAGSSLLSSLLPNSPVGPGTLRHGERNMRLPSGMRNWRPESGGFLDQSFGSSLLDEFKSNKTRCFELSEIAGHVVEFSADQYGSRFIQQKLETATAEEKSMVFHEIIPQALSLMTDVFGNYVIQKFFEHGTTSQIRELADKLTGHVLTLTLQMYGCRVIQKAIEVVDLDQQKKMVVELDGHVMRCVRDQNGNHVIQKCIECIPEDAIQFIISIFYDQVVTLSTHPYGCRVIQRVLEHCHDPTTQRIVMDEIMQSACMLAQDQYGNYVVQHVLEHGKPHERSDIICKLTGKIVQMSQQKFASNVIEKCLAFGDVAERQTMVNEILGSIDENEPLQVMMKDQFGNYVVQKVLETCDDQQLEVILSRIKDHLNALKKYTYGKHIVARVEKLVAAGERRISLQTAYPATTA